MFPNQPLLEMIESPRALDRAVLGETHGRVPGPAPSWTHCCPPPQAKLPRKYFLVQMQREAPGMYPSLSPLCLPLAQWLPWFPSLWLSPQHPPQGACVSFQKAASFPVPVCQGCNPGQTRMCPPLRCQRPGGNCSCQEFGIHNQILWLGRLQIFSVPETRPGGCVEGRGLELTLIIWSVSEWEGPGWHLLEAI